MSNSLNPENLSDDMLVQLISMNKRIFKEAKDTVESLEYECINRMLGRKATAMATPSGKMLLKYQSPTYDQSVLEDLKESIMPDDVEKAYTPAHEEVREIPSKWDGTQLRRIEREYGGHVAGIIEKARIHGAPYVKLEEK